MTGLLVDDRSVAVDAAARETRAAGLRTAARGELEEAEGGERPSTEL